MIKRETMRHRALVTGATGYIGSKLVKRLISIGWTVHIVIRPNSKLTCLMPFLEQITVHKHDGTTHGMVALVAKANPDTVFHLASLFLAEHKLGDVENLIVSNVLFATQLTQAMVNNNVTNFVNSGTSWQYFCGNDYDPVNLYAATKQAFESLLKFYVETNDLKVITLALFDTYGPDDSRKKLIPLFFDVKKTDQELIMSPGRQLIDLVYIDDVIDAFVIAAKLLRKQVIKHSLYGISSKSAMPLVDVVKTFEAVTSITLPIKWGGRSYRAREIMIPWSQHSALPGWEPKTSLREGLTKIKNALDENH